jgi:TIR domain
MHMDYEYDIFISYRRDDETRRWLNDHFVPLLEHRMQLILPYKPRVYTDQRLETGTTWPLELGEGIGKSKILIALWTKTYLNSEWCAIEMSHMLEREAVHGLKQPQNKNGLVVPVIVHDGETLPAPLNIAQRLELIDCFNSRMSWDSWRAEKLSELLGNASKGIAMLIDNVPAYVEQWNIEAKNRFYQLYYQRLPPHQDNLPKFSNP